MSAFFDWIFSQYDGTPDYLIYLELFGGVLFGILSVVFSKMNNIWVYPTGMMGTIIYVYILSVYGLVGDMLINAYYFIMSVYGWYVWTRKTGGYVTPVRHISSTEKKQSVFIFIATMIFVALVYQVLGKWQSWYSYTDILTTAIFFVGMWLMAKKKIENWIYWIVGDIISVPLYAAKGLIFSAILYFVLTIIAIYGYLAWKKLLYKKVASI